MPRKRRSIRLPSMNLRKGISFSKSVCPRNRMFIKKKIREAIIPRATEREKIEFMEIIKIMKYEIMVKRNFSSRTISSSTFLSRNAFSILGPRLLIFSVGFRIFFQCYPLNLLVCIIACHNNDL